MKWREWINGRVMDLSPRRADEILICSIDLEKSLV
jgi:hypothetical protein